MQEDLVRSERLAVTGRMTAQLSHEINNPIHNIQSLLESSLRKVHPDDPARELMAVARDEVNRLATLTRQMLELYRGSVVPLEQEQVDVRALVGEIEVMFSDSLAQERIVLETLLESDLPFLTGSHDKLKQVLINLVLNARDAQPRGGRILIRADRKGSWITLRVSDTGHGIAPEHRDRVFDPFFTTKKEVSGVGLGLAVSYGIVQQHNGRISVDSTVGGGTTFTITLPGHQPHV
jgi:signal transduction histidine kinase